MKNNKLIAEFMGYDIITEAEKDKFPTVLTTKDVKYHSSWDWLMPVVEKIDNLFGENDIVDDMINKVHNAVLQFNRDITYNAVVEFIKDYNTGEIK